MRARIYLIAEREARLVGEYYSPNVCTASIADIASSPSGHKICRTSLATLVMLRTPNSALATLSLLSPLPSLPRPHVAAYACVYVVHVYVFVWHVRYVEMNPIPMHSYVSSDSNP